MKNLLKRLFNSPKKFVIYPYKRNHIWYFNDVSRDVYAEPFCGDINRMIDHMIVHFPPCDVFKATFSDRPFKDWMMEMVKLEDSIYTAYGYTGYLCPVLFKYFKNAPKHIYVKAEPL
jgi:hypothetical protein